MPNSIEDHRASGRWNTKLAAPAFSRHRLADNTLISIPASVGRARIHAELERVRPAAMQEHDRVLATASGPTRASAPLAALLLWSGLSTVQPTGRARAADVDGFGHVSPRLGMLQVHGETFPDGHPSVADPIFGASTIAVMPLPPTGGSSAATPLDTMGDAPAGMRQLTITDPVEQRKMLIALEDFFLKTGYLRPQRLEEFRAQYEGMGTHTAITIFSVPSEYEANTNRGSRAAIGRTPSWIRDDVLLNRDAQVRQSALPADARTCKDGITHYQGGRGDLYIVSGNYIADPFLDVLDNDGKPPTGWQTFWHKTLNLGVTVVSLGMRDAVAFSIAAGLRSHGHVLNERPQCMRREWSARRLANWAGTFMLDGDAAAAESSIRAGQREVAEGERMLALGEAAVYEEHGAQMGREKIAQGRQSEALGWGKIAAGQQPGVHIYRLTPDRFVAGTHDEQVAVAAGEPRPLVDVSSLNAEGENTVGLRLTVFDSGMGRELETYQMAGGLYVAIDRESAAAGSLVRPLTRDSAGNIYFEDDVAAGPLEYKLRMKPPVELVDGQLRVVHGAVAAPYVEQHAGNGFVVRSPVYQDRMSKHYHVMDNNGLPVCRDYELPELERISVERFLTSQEYLVVPVRVHNMSTDPRGEVFRLFRVFRQPESMLDLDVIDLYGHVVPVRLRPSRANPSESQYELVDPLMPQYRGLPVRFDGYRWMTELGNLDHPVQGIEGRPLQAPIAEVFSDSAIHSKDLIARGLHGLWLHEPTGKLFLQVRGRYVRIINDNGQHFAIDAAGERRMPYAFRRATVRDVGRNDAGAVRYAGAEVWDVGWKRVPPAGTLSRAQFNDMHLTEFTGCEHPLFAVDTRSPAMVQREGFRATEKMSVPDMLGGGDTLEVYESLAGAHLDVAWRRMFDHPGPHYIYRINAAQLRGVSLNENALSNWHRLSSFLESRRQGQPLQDTDYFLSHRSPPSPGMEELHERTGGAIQAYPAHISANDVRRSLWNHVPVSTIQ